jgi:murein DD-endopeptidase MepM/ murein hydrolase activator NlpD
MGYRIPFKTLGDLYGSTKNRPHPHRGLDFPQPRGAKVRAVANSTITDHGFNEALGFYVIVLDKNGIYWGYCHLDTFGKIRNGQRVMRGYQLGTVGDTGTAANGPHLHLTASHDSHGYMVGLTLDPLKILKGSK